MLFRFNLEKAQARIELRAYNGVEGLPVELTLIHTSDPSAEETLSVTLSDLDVDALRAALEVIRDVEMTKKYAADYAARVGSGL